MRILWSLVAYLSVAAVPLRSEPPIADAAGLDHVAIFVRDADRSAAFYRKLFGLRQVPAPVPFARWLVMGNGTMLHIVGGRTAPVRNARWDHLALAVPDLAALIARLEAKGVTRSDLRGNPKDWHPRCRGEADLRARPRWLLDRSQRCAQGHERPLSMVSWRHGRTVHFSRERPKAAGPISPQLTTFSRLNRVTDCSHLFIAACCRHEQE